MKTDPNLVQMRYYQNQARNNGAAGVQRSGGSIMKSSSTPGVMVYNAPMNPRYAANVDT